MHGFIVADTLHRSVVFLKVKSRFESKKNKRVPSSQLSSSGNSVGFHYQMPHSSESLLISKNTLHLHTGKNY